MRFRKIFIVLFYAIFLAASFSDAGAMEGKRGRPYNIGRDIGFRWRTTLNVKYGDVQIDSDAEHSRLRNLVTTCNSVFTANNANIMAASLQVVFKDSFSRVIPIEAVVYTRYLKGMPEKARVSCFSTACLTVEKAGQASHPPITYKNRETLEYSIPFIFGAISMGTDCIKVASSRQFQYDYRDTEFQVVHELFSTKEYGSVPGKNRRAGGFQPTERKPRFAELFASLISEKRLEDVALIILHIHTRFDPCSVCAEMLSNLSQTLNYLPGNLLQGKEAQIKQLCEQLKSHSCQFLIEVSSDEPYWNSREAGLDSFYMRQLADISGFGKCPIEIPSADNLRPRYSFPPCVVFKRMDLPIVFDSPGVMNEVGIQVTTDKKDASTDTGRKRRNSIEPHRLKPIVTDRR